MDREDDTVSKEIRIKFSGETDLTEQLNVVTLFQLLFV